MVHTFWNVTGLNLLLVEIQFLLQAILTGILLDKRPDRRKLFVFMVPFGIILAAFGTVEYLNGLFAHVQLLILHNYLNALVWCVGIWYIFKEKWKNAAVTSTVIIFLAIIMEDLAGFFVSDNFDLTKASDLFGYLAVNLLGIPVVAVCFAAILRRVKVCEVYTAFLYEKQRRKAWRILILLLPALHILLIYLVNEKKILNNSNPGVAILSLLLVYGIFNYVFRCELQKKQIMEQNASIQQQKLYIQNLESVQREIRLFRHDYKNMMSGIYLQAEEGDLTAVQDFIGRMTEAFDRQTGEKISQITQLGNVKIPELKGLLAAKLVEIQKKQIHCCLEVSGPVETVSMSAYDLCRAVGILWDNAAEAVEGMDNPVFTCMIAADRQCTTILIKNPVSDEACPADIWREGYSTKGEGRGLGLTSYRRIVDAYDNIFSYTFEENGTFIQELKIQGGAGNDSDIHM